MCYKAPNTPLWICPDKSCETKWFTFDEGLKCPHCHLHIGIQSDLLYSDIPEELFDEEDYIFPVPVPELIQLSLLNIKNWVGLPVFHPCGQEGSIANWLIYDVGIIIDVFPDEAFKGEHRCRFVTGSESTLVYSPDNLWVPKIVAANIGEEKAWESIG